jgi:stage V sporulation protein D (sporulation-specific penicillin-binding protein)
MEKFGLGQKTGITIQGESGGIVMKKNQVKNVDLARMGFGHAIAVTPLQLLTAVAGITNGGILKTPAVIEKVTDINGKTTFEPKVKEKRIISSKTSELVNKLLQHAENKKADYSFVEGYNIGGKTGTAQKYNETGGIAQGKYISSFIGTYPADNPAYLFMILVDEASAGAYYGAIVAAPYGKMFFSKLFDLFNIPKDDPSIKLEEVVMPELLGKSVAEAISTLKKLGVFCEIDGSGGIVKEQLPPAGTIIYKGEVVLIVT